VVLVSESPVELTDAVICPHCHRDLRHARVLGDSHSRRRGFKCPHCRLFVPLERVLPGEPGAPG
jgi:DNA-directed RNA polymerase subunit RPC12/RpoP